MIHTKEDYDTYYRNCVKYMNSGRGNISLTEFMETGRRYQFPKVYEGNSYFLAEQPFCCSCIEDIHKPQLPDALLFHAAPCRYDVEVDISYFIQTYTDVNGVMHRPCGSINRYLFDLIRESRPYLSYREFMMKLVRFIGTNHVCFQNEIIHIYNNDSANPEDVIILNCNFHGESF